MAIVKGDNQSIMTGGWWITDTSGGSTPGEPTLSVVSDGDGDAVTATVDGDAGATNTLFYRKIGASSWTEGSDRSGDGDIAQSGLDDHTFYWFVVVSSSGDYNSVASLQIGVYVTSGIQHIYNIVAVIDPKEKGAMMELLCTEED